MICTKLDYKLSDKKTQQFKILIILAHKRYDEQDFFYSQHLLNHSSGSQKLFYYFSFLF